MLLLSSGVRHLGKGEKFSSTFSYFSDFLINFFFPFFNWFFQLLERTFMEKDVFTKVQDHVENLILTENIQNVHPYCLSLDSINMAILALCNSQCLKKEKE